MQGAVHKAVRVRDAAFVILSEWRCTNMSQLLQISTVHK